MPPLPIIMFDGRVVPASRPLGRWRGVCPSCEGNFALRDDGTMRRHFNGRGVTCRGSGTRPQRRTRHVTANAPANRNA